MLKINNLSKSFGNRKIINNLSLEINKNDFLVLLGPSGCGKTTLLRLISGLENPDSGNIYFDEKNITSYPTQKRNLSFVFQDFGLYPHLTVEKNIAYPLKIKGINKIDIIKKVNHISKKLQINNLLERNIEKLSGGEKQRVSIARALIKKPDLLLLDEPLSNVDPKLKLDLKILIKEVLSNLNIPVIYVTHDQEEAFSIGNKIALLEGGYIHQIGNFEQIIKEPKDLFVSKFITIPPNNIFRYKKTNGEIIISSYNNVKNKIILKKDLDQLNNFIFSVSSYELSIHTERRNIKENNIILKGKFLFSENFGNSYIAYFKSELGILSILTNSNILVSNREFIISISLKYLKKFDTKTKERIVN